MTYRSASKGEIKFLVVVIKVRCGLTKRVKYPTPRPRSECRVAMKLTKLKMDSRGERRNVESPAGEERIDKF